MSAEPTFGRTVADALRMLEGVKTAVVAVRVGREDVRFLGVAPDELKRRLRGCALAEPMPCELQDGHLTIGALTAIRRAEGGES